MKTLRFETVADIKKTVRCRQTYGNGLEDGDLSLVDSLEEIKERIAATDMNLNNVTDPLLIEGYIYELKSLHVRYDYFIKLCKERGLTVEMY